MYYHILRTDIHDPTVYEVWNHRRKDWCICIDKLYERGDGFGYTDHRYAVKVAFKMLRQGDCSLQVVSHKQLIEHIDHVNKEYK